MIDCTRHAFTDGECVTHGCWNCPGRAERRLADINARQRAERAKSGRWINVGIATLLAAILIGLITPQAVENIKTWEVANVPQ
jgi:hypothetical protein